MKIKTFLKDKYTNYKINDSLKRYFNCHINGLQYFENSLVYVCFITFFPDCNYLRFIVV